MSEILKEGPVRKWLKERETLIPRKKLFGSENPGQKAFLGERFIGELVIRPLPPLTSSEDLFGFEVVELQTADERRIAKYRREL